MKVCTYFVLFSIFAYSSPLKIYHETQSNDNAEDSSEYDDKEETGVTEEANIKNVNTDIKSNLISIFRAPGITIAGFIEEIINILKTFEDESFVDFLNVLDSEIRKYHYPGCKFSEVMNNYDTRKFLATTLSMIRDQPASEIRENIDTLAETIKNEAFDNNLKELLTYIDSLYVNAGEKLLKVINDLEEFTNSESVSTEQDLEEIIKNGVRSVLFEHYTNLNISTRRELKYQIEKFWKNYKEAPSRRMPNIIPKTHAINIVNNTNRHKIKKLEPVEMERFENRKNINDKNRNKRRFEPANSEYARSEDDDAKVTRKTKKHQELSNFELGKKEHKTRSEIEPRLGVHYDIKSSSRHRLKNASRERLQPREPLNSIRLNRHIQRHNMDNPYKNRVEFIEDLNENTQTDLDYEEMKERTASHIDKIDNEPIIKADTAKPQRSHRKDKEEELMKKAPMLSFYLTTKSDHVSRLTRPTTKPHYKFQDFNNETAERLSKSDIDKFNKENRQRAFSSVEKDPHVIKRIKYLESELYQVRNKVNKVNNDVVRIKKVLFNSDAKKNSERFSNALRVGKDKSKMAGAGDIEREILENNEEMNYYHHNDKTTNYQDIQVESIWTSKDKSKMAGAGDIEREILKNNEEINYHHHNDKTANYKDIKVESIWTSKVFNVTPYFKAKENKLKKTTTENQDDTTEKDRSKPVRTSTTVKNVSDKEVTDVKTTSTTTVTAVTTTSTELLTTPATTKVISSSKVVSEVSTEPNSSLDISDGKPSNNYVIKVY